MKICITPVPIKLDARARDEKFLKPFVFISVDFLMCFIPCSAPMVLDLLLFNENLLPLAFAESALERHKKGRLDDTLLCEKFAGRFGIMK